MRLSFRARILLVVLAVAVLPLGLIGLWLTGSAARSGEALLRSRLEGAVEADARSLELSWVRYRTALLDLADMPEVQRALRAPPGEVSEGPPPSLQAAFASLELTVEGLIVRDRAGRALWQLGRTQSDAGSFLAFGALLNAELALYDAMSGEAIGYLQALVPINALRPSSAAAAAISAVITARDPTTGALLLPAPFDPSLLEAERFTWNEEDWITVRRLVLEPRVELVAVAPVAPFAAPFRDAARRGAVVLVIAAAIGIGVAGVITARLTRSLERLAAAAGDVAGGHFGRRMEVRTQDEVGRVAHAFNTMTDSLRRTLDQLAERESLAAVNEFAAALAHEVRNPLTSIRLDLQEVEERLPETSPLRSIQGRALEDVERLDRTVAGALETARSGHIEPRDIDLREPVGAAVRAAVPAFDDRGAQLQWEEPPEPATVRGDPDALERVVLNLLLNAAEALEGEASASVELTSGDGHFTISVHDTGRGISDDSIERVFDPFFTTRPGGTGVGLAVARRIVTAHRGEISLSSEPGAGTIVQVKLPAAQPNATT